MNLFIFCRFSNNRHVFDEQRDQKSLWPLVSKNFLCQLFVQYHWFCASFKDFTNIICYCADSVQWEQCFWYDTVTCFFKTSFKSFNSRKLSKFRQKYININFIECLLISRNKLDKCQLCPNTKCRNDNYFNFQEHQNVDVGLYGVDIPIQAENLVIMIMNGSNASFALIKVFGMCNNMVYAIKQFHRYYEIQ